MKLNKVTELGILTALYVVLASLMKIPIIGNISLDLGYIVFSVALFRHKWRGIFVGVIGCALESILFSAYGFSISWCAMNLVIGILVNLVFLSVVWPSYSYKSSPEKLGMTILAGIVGSVFIGAFTKGGIECLLYGIPFVAKLPKILTAFVLDSITMIIGSYIHVKILKLERRKQK